MNFSKFLQSALFSKIHSYVAPVFQKRISSLKMDYFSILVYQYANIEDIRKQIHDLIIFWRPHFDSWEFGSLGWDIFSLKVGSN